MLLTFQLKIQMYLQTILFQNHGFHYVLGYSPKMDIYTPKVPIWITDKSLNPRFKSSTLESYSENSISWKVPKCDWSFNDPWLKLTHPNVGYIFELAKYYPIKMSYPENCNATSTHKTKNNSKYQLVFEENAFCPHYSTQSFTASGQIPISKCR